MSWKESWIVSKHFESNTPLPFLSIFDRHDSVEVSIAARLMTVPSLRSLAFCILTVEFSLLSSLAADLFITLTVSSSVLPHCIDVININVFMISLKCSNRDPSGNLRAANREIYLNIVIKHMKLGEDRLKSFKFL